MKFDYIVAERPNKTVYRDGDRCIKVFSEGFSKADVLNEALNQARVEDTGLNLPAIREVTVVDGKWAIVTDFIEGKTLSQLMKEHPARREEYLAMLVDIQLSIHQHTCPLLTKLKDKMHRKISSSSIDATVRYELHTRLEGMPKHNKLCHGDLCPSNVIITEDGTPYVIDWAHATQGNASADAARTYLTFRLSGDEEAAESYLRLFCRKSDTARQYVEKWMPIVAASQSVKGKTEEKELLMSWVNVVDWQ